MKEIIYKGKAYFSYRDLCYDLNIDVHTLLAFKRRGKTLEECAILAKKKCTQ